ncbi:MAG TPA: YceI family protein [Gaiellaceae bacterium]|nr:YceI family protein [Gaiellaceae bacterium]
MSTILQAEQAVPTGTWTLDKVHSSVGYAVRHSGVSLFKGDVTDVDAELVDGTLRGSADVSSITVNDENLQAHLLSPEFFDVERTPRVSFESTSIRRDGDELAVEGELEIRGVARPVTLKGTIAGPVAGPAGEKLGVALETVVDRTSFGITWNMELPGGGSILDNEVTLTANLELAKA